MSTHPNNFLDIRKKCQLNVLHNIRHVKDIYRISRENAMINKQAQLISMKIWDFPLKFVQKKLF